MSTSPGSSGRPGQPPRRSRGLLERTPVHLAFITLASAVACLPGLTSHGLTNWQESIRLVVAREMQQAGSFVVPILHGEPYLAKPPLIYWLQMLSAWIRGSAVELFDLRLVVAIAAWTGSLGTYWAARVLLSPNTGDSKNDTPWSSRWASTAALWAGLFCATGTLVVRGGRIGELDILLLPATTVGIAGFAGAYLSPRGKLARIAGGITIGVAACVAGSIAKGPPGVATVLAAIVGGVLLRAAFEDRGATARAWVVVASLVGLVVGTALLMTRPIDDYRDVLGAALHALVAGTAALVIARASTRAGRALVGILRSGVLLGLLAGAAAIWLWGSAVRAEIGDRLVDQAAQAQLADNLRLFVLTSPVRNLETLAYGAGMGSLAAIIAGIWILKDRPRPGPGFWIVLGWVGAGFLIFSLAGKGPSRYVLPVLPGVAILGGAWFASALRDASRPLALGRTAAIGIAALAIGQSWWYGFARASSEADDRSPRDFMSELLLVPGVDPDRLAALHFWSGGLDNAAGQPVEPFRDSGAANLYDFPRHVPEIDSLMEELRTNGGTWTLLIRENPERNSGATTTPMEQLQELGFVVEPIPVTARYVIDKRTNAVVPVRVRASD